MKRHKNHVRGDEGSALLLAVMILAALGVLGTAIVLSGTSDRHASRFERDGADALAAAESGLELAKNQLQQMSAPVEDSDGDLRPDFTLSGTLPWGGSYTVFAEAGEIRDIGLPTYRAHTFAIVAEGRVRGATRRVMVQLEKDTLLKFGRFVQETGTGYNCRDEIDGELYVGGNLNIATCDPDDYPLFLERVYVTGQVNNNAGGIFLRGYTEFAPPISILNSVDFDEVRDMAKGIASENDCESRGNVGFYQNRPTWDPIGMALTGNVLNLTKFDFHNTTLVPGDTIITYAGSPCLNTVTGQPMRARDFNGVVFFEGDGRVKGIADGRSGRSMSIFSTTDITADSSVVTGHEGFDPATGLPDGTGFPVNLGLIANYYVYLGPVPQVCEIDASIIAVNQDVRARIPAKSAHPPLTGQGPIDLDCDGIIGESPHNNELEYGAGWDELNIGPDHWRLNLNGPLITRDGGSMAPWNDGDVMGGAPGPTWKYNYDRDVMAFPPPCFPDPLNLWQQVSWTEIFEVESDLTSYLPN